MHISVISPVYQAEKIVDELVMRLVIELSKITNDFEIILVEDGSKDKSWEAIENSCKKDPRVKGIKLVRNFGQHNAVTCGLDYCKGDFVIIMDCDLQDLPEEINKLYSKAEEGHEVVLARRVVREDSIVKKLTSWLFFKVFNYLSGMEYDYKVGGFRLISKKVVENFRLMREQSRFYPGLIEWMGFPAAYVDVKHSERFEGQSTYGLKKLLKHAVDVVTSYSDKPLRVSVKIGFFMSLFAFLYGSYVFIASFFYHSPITGWTSLIVSMYFLSGIIITVLGILGIYLGKVFTQVKGRPLYIVHKTMGVLKDTRAKGLEAQAQNPSLVTRNI